MTLSISPGSLIYTLSRGEGLQAEVSFELGCTRTPKPKIKLHCIKREIPWDLLSGRKDSFDNCGGEQV